MARVTVEDCMEVVSNRFELVAIASQRAKSIYSGAAITVERNNDKNSVVALREIAEGKVDRDQLREGLIQRNQRHIQVEQSVPDEEETSEAAEDITALQEGQPTEAQDGYSYGADNVEVED